MYSDEAAQHAVRQKLLALVAATTGNISISASPNGGVKGGAAFIRAAGDFRADKLREGMEVQAGGFAAQTGYNNGAATIIHISPDGLTLSTDRALITEVAGGGRSLVAGLPALRGWENKSFDQAKAAGRPYIDEQFIAGPGNQRGCGPGGYLYYNPMYITRIYVPRGVGIGADSMYGDALKNLFAPGTAMAIPGHVEPLRVRRDVAPPKGQRQFAVEGYVTVEFPIPLEIWTPNVI